MSLSLLSFQELFYGKFTGLQITHFPPLKFYQDLQHKATLPMREMNQLPLFFLSMMKKQQSLICSQVLLWKETCSLLTKRKFQGVSFLRLFTLAGILISVHILFSIHKNHPSRFPCTTIMNTSQKKTTPETCQNHLVCTTEF